MKRLLLPLIAALLVLPAWAQDADTASDPKPGYDTAVLQIDFGGRTRVVAIKLFPDDAPKTVNNFKSHIESGYYKGTVFHRAIADLLVQTGDPLTKESGNRAEWGTGGNDYTVPAEIKLKHARGSVAMARLGDASNPNRESSGSQFYFALKPLEPLDGKYTIFGEVVQGLDVLDAISRVVVDTNDAPVERVEIVSTSLVKDAGDIPEDEKPKRTKRTVRESDKGAFTKLIERIW
ncbi:MAG: peptidylprolyl isomerase [Verrucomicrobiales bacterium]